MIYLYGTGNKIKLIFGGHALSDEQKANATLILESLPPTNTPPGKVASMYIDPVTKQFSYVYIDPRVLPDPINTVEVLEEDEPLLEPSLNYSDMTVTELKALCKELGLTGYSSLTKAELIEMIEYHDKVEQGN